MAQHTATAGRLRASGLLLAAGAGRRMEQPKALVRDREGIPWVVRAARTLRLGGCDDVHVVVGAQAPEVRQNFAPPTTSCKYNQRSIND